MLKSLKIENFALIKQLELNFCNGFNVLIGETGAGKSLILKALKFVLGDKQNKNQIRDGENKMTVEAVFDEYNDNVIKQLEQLGFEDEGILIVKRSFDINGKQEIRINGNIISLSMLKQITENLAQIYSQHEGVELLKVSKHLEILDSYQGALLEDVKTQISQHLAEYKQIKEDINSLGGDAENRARTLDLLSYQIQEIETINVKPGEDEEIENKLELMRNAEKLKNALSNASNNLSFNILTNLKDSIKTLQTIENISPKYQSLIEKLNNNYYEIMDVSEEISALNQELNYSEYDIEKLDTRLDEIKNLKKKYGKTIDDIILFYNNIINEKQKLENADENLNKLEIKLKDKEAILNNLCEELTQKRQQIARKFEQNIKNELAYLGMKNARLQVQFSALSEFSSKGLDSVEFMFSANAGQELKPISKTISGGELSRFMLALKSMTAKDDYVDMLVFDEIDSGISGEVGSAIGEKIALISKNWQVLCITHLPQVTAMADRYLFISKAMQNGNTSSSAKVLEGEEIIKAIARLSGGDYLSSSSLQHASELKTWAEGYKRKI